MQIIHHVKAKPLPYHFFGCRCDPFFTKRVEYLIFSRAISVFQLQNSKFVPYKGNNKIGCQ